MAADRTGRGEGLFRGGAWDLVRLSVPLQPLSLSGRLNQTCGRIPVRQGPAQIPTGRGALVIMNAMGQSCAHTSAGDYTDMEAEACGQGSVPEYHCAHGRAIWTDVPQYNEMIERMFSLWSVGESFKLVRLPSQRRVVFCLPPLIVG